MPPRLRRLLPDHPVARQLSIQSVLFAIGGAVFSTGNAVYFTQIVGLTAAQVGLGLSLTGVLALVLSVPFGKVADRYGARRMWTLGCALDAALYLTYPFIHGFVAFVAVLSGFMVAEVIGVAGRGAYSIAIFAREERVAYQAYLRSALNVGLTLGALACGLVLATNDHGAIRALPVATSVLLLVNAFMLSRLPDPQPQVAVEPAVEPEPGPEPRHRLELDVLEADPEPSPPATRNRGFVAAAVLGAIPGTHWILLTVVIPLWLVQRTDAPHWLLAWLFATNTIGCVLFQVAAARGANTIRGALRAIRIASAFMVCSCAVIAVTDGTVGWVSVALLLVGHMTVTGAELFESAATWSFLSELSDPHRRGEYQGVWGVGERITNILGPGLFTWLAIDQGTVGWVVIALTILVGTALMHPAVRAAERFLATHALDPSAAAA